MWDQGVFKEKAKGWHYYSSNTFFCLIFLVAWTPSSGTWAASADICNQIQLSVCLCMFLCFFSFHFLLLLHQNTGDFRKTCFYIWPSISQQVDFIHWVELLPNSAIQMTAHKHLCTENHRRWSLCNALFSPHVILSWFVTAVWLLLSTGWCTTCFCSWRAS